MKIEIGESLIYSYLRQVNNCTITQTNWKPSTNWKYSKISYKKVEETFSLIKSNDSLSDVFPSEISQTIKQAEIDVIGINYDTVYAVDIAYHENGLNYGDKEETRVRVIKKLLRTLLILDLYFPEFKHIIMFCSPKVNPATEKNIQEYIDIIRNNFSNEKNDFVYLSNQNFYKNIIEPTIIKTESEADTSELFIRSYKLLGLFKEDNFVSKERNNEEINIKDSIYTKNDANIRLTKSSRYEATRRCGFLLRAGWLFK
jgi:hypothetical protein